MPRAATPNAEPLQTKTPDHSATGSQELRNATVRGRFNDAIKEMAQFPAFRKLIQVDPSNISDSRKVQKMEDVELVLRFFSLRKGRYKTIKKGFREFLTESLSEFNGLTPEQIEKEEKTFFSYINFIENHLGNFAFAKWRIEEGLEKRMSSFNAAVYDAVAVGLSETFTPKQLADNPNAAKSAIEGYKSLFGNDDFFSSVSGSVNDAAKVIFRIDAMKRYLRG